MFRLLILLLITVLAHAQQARWIRYPAISPDGERIAFSYRGDLWLVSSRGGEARPLTTHVDYERSPIWSPDSRRIAFTSDRHGNFGVFVVDVEGGRARRLTHHSTGDYPECFSRDGKRLLFTSWRTDAAEACIGSPWMPELYSISLDGGQPRQELTTPALHARLSPDGARMAYEDMKGYENWWRKHHVSAVARDIWILDRATGRHRRLTSFRGEDREAAWGPGGETILYLSERAGSFNVFRRRADGSGEVEQLTHHDKHPVRFLTVAADGTLAYAWDGSLWVRPPDGEPRRLSVVVRAGERTNPERSEVFRSGATESVLSPSGKELAIVVRGEVFVVSARQGTTRGVTDTATQERSVVWAPDGRSLYYAGEREGSWNLYKSSLVRESDEHFFRALELKEEAVLATPADEFQPQVSPDGKRIAYLHDRDEIRLLDLASGETRTLVPASRNYSYSDGDMWFDWSPDSRWIACHLLAEGRWTEEVAIIDVESGTIANATKSGYYDSWPRWSRDGTAVFFSSNRSGLRNHGGWRSEQDVYAVHLTQKAFDRAKLSPDELKLREGKPEKKKEKKEEKKEEVEPVEIEFDRIDERLKRLTIHSAMLGGSALSPDGERLVYCARVEDKWDLWLSEWRKSSTRKLLPLGEGRSADVAFDEKGEAVYVRKHSGAILRVSVPGGEAKPVPYAARMTVRAPAEREYIFEHVWRQAGAKFYEPTLHGADWEGLRRYYGAFLSHIDNGHDFAELLSEMLGELNASHTGGRYRPPEGRGDQTAVLGLIFVAGHRVAEVLEGGPFDQADERPPAGSVLTHIDGTELNADTNRHRLLNHKAGRRVLLVFRKPDGTSLERVIEPIDADTERGLLYKRWVKRCRERTEKLSGGRLGYVHVRGMGDRSFRTLHKEALGRHGTKKGLVIDTRFNGGGNLHDDLVVFLGGREYLIRHPRGKQRGEMGVEPGERWTRPVIVVQNEGNYSDAHIFPYAFRELGLGKLVGTPVAGTGTAVWFERQIDPEIAFGIPQVGYVTLDGKYLENTELWPDIEVYNDPESRARGEDKQLEKAIEALLQEVPGTSSPPARR